MEWILTIFRSPGAEIFQAGAIILRWYGLIIAIAVLIGLNLSIKLGNKIGIQKGIINDLFPWLVISSIVGARIYYILFEWRNYSGVNFWSSINFFGIYLPIPSALEIWGGGIAIHGALLGGALSLIIFSRVNKQDFWRLLDIIVPSIALGQALGRWGNFFNNEAFGTPTNLPWKLFIPYIYRPETYINDEYFHPTFLYESLWNFIIFIMLIILFNRARKGLMRVPKGGLSCIYLISYSSGRFWIEGLRTDPLCINSLPPFCEGGYRMAQIISLIFIISGSLRLWWLYRQDKKMSKKRNLPPNNYL